MIGAWHRWRKAHSTARLLPQRHVDLAQLLIEPLQLVLALPRRHACTEWMTPSSRAERFGEHAGQSTPGGERLPKRSIRTEARTKLS